MGAFLIKGKQKERLCGSILSHTLAFGGMGKISLYQLGDNRRLLLFLLLLTVTRANDATLQMEIITQHKVNLKSKKSHFS